MNTYQSAGVDKQEGYKTVERIKTAVEKTHNKNVLNTLGGFGAFYELGKYENPVLVSGTDGVGTKIKLALEHKSYQSIGIDCFAMCVNDILCHGAKPLFFLDYMACGKLDSRIAAQIVESMAQACGASQTALIGGETAEMPDVYRHGDYDVAGFCVGVVEKEQMITGAGIGAGDQVLALPSSGFHSNGFSLIRKIFTENESIFEGKKIIDHLLEPTRIYTQEIQKLMENCTLKGIAHITGGGIIENFPRTIPDGFGLKLKAKKVKIPGIMKLLQQRGNIAVQEMFGTFNMGVGIMLVVGKNEVDKALSLLNDAYVVGEIEVSSQKIEIDYEGL